MATTHFSECGQPEPAPPDDVGFLVVDPVDYPAPVLPEIVTSECQSAWQAWAKLWLSLRDPMGAEPTAEAVGELYDLFRRLQQCGMRFDPRFVEDLEAVADMRARVDGEGGRDVSEH